LLEYCDWALVASLPGGWDFLEHPDQVNADNISVKTTKKTFTLLFIVISFSWR
jgi:hypothetical protein